MVGENMKKILKSIILIALFHLFSIIAYGEINLSADRVTVSINEGIKIRVEFIDEDSKNYRIEGLENFQVMGKSSSRSISIINLKKSSQEREEYLLKPLTVGNHTLKVITTKNESKPLEIKVTDEAIFPSTIGTIPSSGGAQAQENFIMLSTLGDNGEKKYYFGEKIFIEEKFVLFRNPRGFSIISRPEYKDFIEKDFTPRDRNGNPIQNITDYKGRESLQTLLYRGVIQGISSGKKQVKGIGVEIITDDYYYPGALKKEIEILPLPEGKPENFNGIVGKLNMDYSFNKKTAQVGEVVLLNLKLFGDVNLDNIEKIGIISDENFTVHETLKNRDERVDENGYYSEKNFEIAFIPRNPGKLTIPEINIYYLDTQLGEYIDKKISKEKIDVIGDRGAVILTENSAGEIQESKIEKTPSIEFVEELSFTDKIFIDKKIIISSLATNFFIVLIFIFMGIKKILEKIKKKEIPSWETYLKKMNKKSELSEFYENYCRYMQIRYGFNPKTQSEAKIKDEILKECNREIEKAIYIGKDIDRKKFIEKMREAN